MLNKKIKILLLLSCAIFNTPFCQSFFDTRLNEDCTMDLIWSFENEQDYDHFAIERSTDGKTFISVGIVDASSLNDNNQYVFSDNSQSFHNYYRLKIITNDGRNTLSKVIHTKNDCGIDGYVEVYPNPIIAKESRLSINFFTSRMTIPIVLYGNNGETIKTFNVDTPKEWNALSMDVSGVESGTYYIEIGEVGMSRITIINDKESLSSK